MKLKHLTTRLISLRRAVWQCIKKIPSRKILSFGWFLPSLEYVVELVLKLGTLFLVSLFLLFIFRIFQDQGYILESFSVPQELEESGYTGQVIALRIQDELVELKGVINSVKDDSLELKSNNTDIDLSVLGLGLSLKSIAFQIREAMGKKNKTIRGEVTQLGDRLEIQIRMTGYPKIIKKIALKDLKKEVALDQLIKKGAEGILYQTDPYRLALLCRYEKRYEEGINTLRHLLRTNEKDAQWALLGWGAILEDQGKIEEAIEKYQKSVEVDPNFSLGWQRLAWKFQAKKEGKKAIEALQKVTNLKPKDPWRKVNLAWMFFQNEMYEQVDSTFELAIELAANKKERVNIMLSWAETKLNQDDLVGTKKLLEKYNSDIGESALSYLVKGMVAFTENDTTMALHYLKEGFNIDPSMVYIVQANLFSANTFKNYREAINIFKKITWAKFQLEQKQRCYNQAALAYNMLGVYDSAHIMIQQTIEILPGIGYPYATLGETFAFEGQLDSCFFYIEKAFEKGMTTAFLNKELPPYDFLWDMIEFQDILRKYEQKEDAIE